MSKSPGLNVPEFSVRGGGEVDRSNPMSYEGTIRKTIAAFSVLIVFAAVGWATPQYMLAYLGVAFVLGLVGAFKKRIGPVLTFAYAVAEGLMVGALSVVLDGKYPGVVMSAIVATLSIFAVGLVMYRKRVVRVTSKSRRFFVLAALGYLVFSLVNLGLQLTGVLSEPFGLFGGSMGVIFSLLGAGLASYSLLVSFDTVERGVENAAPEHFEWRGAFGLIVSVVWLYTEMLRLFSVIQR